MKDPLCVCGHRRRRHESKVGCMYQTKFFGKYVGQNWFCKCMKFRKKRKVKSG